MRFAFDPEQDMLRDMIRSALSRDAGLGKVRRWADTAETVAFDDFVAAQGWIGIGVAEEIGGQGGGLIEQAILFEELGRGAAPSGGLLAFAAAQGLAAAADGGIASGFVEGAGTVLCTNAGRALDGAVPQADILRQDCGRLSGTVSLVLQAAQAGRLLVPVATADGASLWWVDAAAAGVQIRPRRLIDRTRHFADVVLQDAATTPAGGLDSAALADAAARLALLVAAESLGCARRMLEMTVDYVSQRVQFGVPVGSFQAVKHAAAELLVDIEAAHSGVYYAAWALQNGEGDGPIHAWIAKAFATEAAARAADRALMLHGAIGYTWEHDLQLFYKRAKLNLELFGSPRRYRERIADTLPLTGNRPHDIPEREQCPSV